MKLKTILFLSLSLFHSANFAQESAVKANVTIPETEVVNIHSERADADYQLWIAKPIPGAFPFSNEPLGVLYVLDANLLFGTAVEMTRLMSQLYGELPPILIVGIAYSTNDPVIQAELRTRDFTPTTIDYGSMNGSFPGAPTPTLPADRRSGRSEQFLQFLIHEVKPLVSNKYNVSESGSTLFGSSFGGLFTAYTLLNHPDAFDAYIAVSPALWWDNRTVLTDLKTKLPLLEPVDSTLFLAVGADEERSDIPNLAQFRMISNLREFAESFQALSTGNFKLTTFVAEGESHTTVIPVALTRALRSIYPPVRPAWMR